MAYIRQAFKGNGGVSSDSQAIDCTGGNLLFLCVYHEGGVTLSSLTVGGSATGITHKVSSADALKDLYYLASPPTGSQTVAYTLSGAASRCYVRAALYDSYSSLRTALASFDETGPSVSGTPESGLGDTVVSFVTSTGTDLQSGSSLVDRSIEEDWESTFRCAGLADKPGDMSTTTVSWTGTGAEYFNVLSVAIAPAAEQGTGIPGRRIFIMP